MKGESQSVHKMTMLGMMSSIRDLGIVVYEAVTPIQLFYRVPRFGHTDFTDIFGNGQVDRDTAKDYVLGSMFITGFYLVIFIAWLLVLFLCRSLGKRAGICAGYPFETSSESLNTDVIGVQRRQMLLRIFMVIASLLVITSGCVFNIKAGQSVSNLLEDLQDGTAGLIQLNQSLTDTGVDLGNFIQSTFGLKLDVTQALKDGICLDQGYYDPNITKEAISFLTSLQKFGDDKLMQLREELAHFFDIAINILLVSMNIIDNYVRPLYVGAPVVALGLILALGSILTLLNRGNRFLFIAQTWVVLPLFFITIFLLGLTTSVIGFTMVANADVCLGGGPHINSTPERTVEVIVQNEGLDGVAREAINYYIINGCEGDFFPTGTLVDYLSIGQNAIGDIHVLMQTDLGMETLEIACGEGIHRIKDAISDLNDSLNEFVRISESALDVLDCKKVNAIFIQIFHHAICESLPYSFVWAFLTWSLIFSVGAMMILFRGALHPTVYSIDEETTLGETITQNDPNIQCVNKGTSYDFDPNRTNEGTSHDLLCYPTIQASSPVESVSSPAHSERTRKSRAPGVVDRWWNNINIFRPKADHDDIEVTIDK